MLIPPRTHRFTNIFPIEFIETSILVMNGIYESNLSAKRAYSILEKILAESCTLFGHERNGVIHPREPVLNTYFYKHNAGASTSSGSSNERSK